MSEANKRSKKLASISRDKKSSIIEGTSLRPFKLPVSGKGVAELYEVLRKAAPDSDAIKKAGRSEASLRAAHLVKEMRTKAGLTQAQLAEKTGIKQSALSDIERGIGVLGPSYDVIDRIAKACNRSIVAQEIGRQPEAAAIKSGNVDASDFAESLRMKMRLVSRRAKLLAKAREKLTNPAAKNARLMSYQTFFREVQKQGVLIAEPQIIDPPADLPLDADKSKVLVLEDAKHGLSLFVIYNDKIQWPAVASTEDSKLSSPERHLHS